jgi:hypothetical protein
MRAQVYPPDLGTPSAIVVERAVRVRGLGVGEQPVRNAGVAGQGELSGWLERFGHAASSSEASSPVKLLPGR